MSGSNILRNKLIATIPSSIVMKDVSRQLPEMLRHNDINTFLHNFDIKEPDEFLFISFETMVIFIA